MVTRNVQKLAVLPVGMALILGLAAFENASADTGADIIAATGVQGGVVVHLGCGDGSLTAALRVNGRYQVHGLTRDASAVADARAKVAATGNYGDVSIDRLSGDRLPYIDNMVNLVVTEELGDVSLDEVMRVLTPNGVAYIKSGDEWKKTVKPWPSDIDEWTHYLHDAGGNAVAHDDVVGPPRHLQWLGSPRWSRHHDRMASMSALVSAGGRMFYIMDEGSRISIQMPPKWMLVARDAFNGTVLWKQPIPNWQNHLWPLKSGPTQLARRLVADGDRVYVTLGLQAPVTVIDAATGDIIRTVEGSDPTEELIVSNGTLLALVNKGTYDTTTDFTPAFNTGDQARVRTDKQFHWNEQAREVVGINGDTGEVLWRRESIVGPLSLAADPDRVYFHNGQGVVCLDRESGKELWASEPAGRAQDFTLNFGPKLVVHNNVVLFAGGDRKMVALEATTGKPMWTAPHAKGGYQSPEDLLVASGLVWSAPTTSGRDSGIWTGRDLMTGEVKNEFPPNVDTYWFHHRCYIAKATDKYLMPSRTGIEFVDHANQDWDINHWVRGGCLYGVMPCNGLLYAPPHNCACYPEAKLFGMNALAPANASRDLPAEVSDEGRLERGPAYENISDAPPADTEWPTYRHDAARSGFLKQDVAAKLNTAWKTDFDSKLSSVVVAYDKLFVAEVDRHALHALNAETGEKAWSFTAGGRIDSPPTIHKGRAIFGAADGWVYCLRASDGELAWRFRAAPRDERLMAFEQLESVWPIHGSVLVENDVIYFVAGRSNFLDSGMRFFRVHAETGRKISEGLMDDRDPHTGEDLQNHIKVLQMPVALPDILSSDSVYVYLRSQQIDMEGNRLEIGPHSGDFAGQASVQRGPTQHLFAPMGFLDDTWFHRSYWVYGRSFAGGHGGYFQAGKYTPSGRLLVFDDDNVYGYGRKPEYLKWTTTIEHQLFASGKEPPPQARSEADEKLVGKKNAAKSSTMIRYGKPSGLNPANKALTVEAWINADRPEGVVVAHGGPAVGYALVLRGGKPQFIVRTKDEVTVAKSKVETVGRWTHLVGVLSADKQVKLYINGKLVDEAKAPSLVPSEPAQGLEIGADDGGAVGDYQSPLGFTGMIDEVRIYHAVLSDEEIADHASTTDRTPTDDRRLVLASTFEGGTAEDVSGNGNDGELDSALSTKGKFGRAVQFSSRQSPQASGSFVEHLWTQDVPLMVRAMVKANDKLFIAGPPDLIDEEDTFQRTMARDPNLASQLSQQDDALAGKAGGIMRVVSAADGTTLAEYKLDTLPAWDGMAAANGRLFMSTTDGNVICYAAE